MLDDHADGSATPETNDAAGEAAAPAAKKATRKRTTKKTAAPAEDTTGDHPEGGAPAEKPKKKSAGKKTTAAKAASAKKTPAGDADGTSDGEAEKPAKKATRKKTTKKAGSASAKDAPADGAGDDTAQPSIAAVFQAPDAAAAAPARRTAKKAATGDQDARHDADTGEGDEQEGDDRIEVPQVLDFESDRQPDRHDEGETERYPCLWARDDCRDGERRHKQYCESERACRYLAETVGGKRGVIE